MASPAKRCGSAGRLGGVFRWRRNFCASACHDGRQWLSRIRIAYDSRVESGSQEGARLSGWEPRHNELCTPGWRNVDRSFGKGRLQRNAIERKHLQLLWRWAEVNLQSKERLRGCVHHPPELSLPGLNIDDRQRLSRIDRRLEVDGEFVWPRQPGIRVVELLTDHHHAFRKTLRALQSAFDDDGSGSSPFDLGRGVAMHVRVIPEQPRRIIRRDLNVVLKRRVA